jgi:hypothetical protein
MSGQRPRIHGDVDVFGQPVRVKWSPVGLGTFHVILQYKHQLITAGMVQSI